MKNILDFLRWIFASLFMLPSLLLLYFVYLCDKQKEEYFYEWLERYGIYYPEEEKASRAEYLNCK